MALEVLTHSKRSAFMNCHRYYYHRHIERLEHRAKRKGRRRGDIFGDTLFEIQQFGIRDDVETIPTHAAVREVASTHLDRRYDKLLEEDVHIDDPGELELERVKILEMVCAYVEKYGIDKRREIEFSYPLINPATRRSSRKYKLGGKIDGVVIPRPKHARIIEDKFVGQIQKAMIERLPLDNQATGYVDAFLHQGWTAEVAYRHTRFPGINPAKPKEYKTKDDYPGETLEEFADRLYDDIRDRWDFYFDEQILIFPTEHIDDYRRGRWQTSQDIIHKLKQPDVMAAFFMNPSRCWEYGGCEFIPLCTKQEGARDLYEVTVDNPELQDIEEGEAVSEYAGEAA